MRNTLPIKIALVITLLASITSCANTKGWVYKANSYNLEGGAKFSKIRDKSISVLPFVDKRDNDNRNALMLYLLPLSPFGYQNLSSPETVGVHVNSGLWVNFNPKEDFAKAMAEELSSSGIAKEAFFSQVSTNSDYYVKGEIISMRYNGKMITYGLSVYGSFLWYIGLPATHVSNELSVNLGLFDSKSKKLLFQKTYEAERYKKTGWIYSLPNDFYYPDMLKSIYKNFMDDITSDKKLADSR